MNIKKLLFWTHLVFGCAAAIFVFIMSITGAALTYERQIIHFAEKLDYPIPPNKHAKTLSIDTLVAIANNYPHDKSLSLTIRNEENAFIQIKEGRKTLAYLNPYTGHEVISPGKETKVFLSKLRAFHRWLTLDGSFSETGRWVNGIANAIFLFLVISGIYLWLPNRLNKRALKQKLTFAKSYQSKNSRDYQWHNVFGIYLAPVLIIIVVTAFFFSFKWPGNMLKQAVSNESTVLELTPQPMNAKQSLSQQALFNGVIAVFEHWQRIQFTLPKSPMNIQSFNVDLGNGGEPQKRYKITLNTQSGEVVQQTSFSDLSTYRKARSYIRFLHTGEALGLLGQTIAGLSSLFVCLLVYTGLMLSIRRWKNYQKRQSNSKQQLTTNSA